jgi:acetamidase/formamidase
MRRLLPALLLMLTPSTLLGQSTFSGDWQATVHFFGSTQYATIHLEQTGEKVTGTIFGTKIECQVQATVCAGTVREGENPPNGTIRITLKGSEIQAQGSDTDGPFDFVARRPVAPSGAPRTHQFTPTKFYNYFSSKYEPVLHIAPGDTIETWSVDAGGIDASGKRRSPGGNPLTGPFFVDGAWPGDTLVVKLNRVRLTRDTAMSGDQIVPSALGPGYYRNLKFDEKFSSEWTLDRAAGVARLTKPSPALKNYTVPLKPMLGCIAVAPPQDLSFRSGYLGAWGGNMDFNQLGEGATVYLPVMHPGALLFLGDGHAAQGDGELTGDALETSMEFSVTVDLVKNKNVPQPRAENAQFRMASGIANSLPEALQQATTNLARWLTDDYKLTPNEVAIVLGTAMQYQIAEVVDPLVHVVAKIDKKALAGLQADQK